MKPAKLKKVKAARVKEGDQIVMALDGDDAGDGYVASDVRRVVPAAKKLANGEKQTPGHLMTITVTQKRFRVLPTADLYVKVPEIVKKPGRPTGRKTRATVRHLA